MHPCDWYQPSFWPSVSSTCNLKFRSQILTQLYSTPTTNVPNWKKRFCSLYVVVACAVTTSPPPRPTVFTYCIAIISRTNQSLPSRLQNNSTHLFQSFTIFLSLNTTNNKQQRKTSCILVVYFAAATWNHANMMIVWSHKSFGRVFLIAWPISIGPTVLSVLTRLYNGYQCDHSSRSRHRLVTLSRRAAYNVTLAEGWRKILFTDLRPHSAVEIWRYFRWTSYSHLPPRR
jgi:hypothetical protein